MEIQPGSPRCLGEYGSQPSGRSGFSSGVSPDQRPELVGINRGEAGSVSAASPRSLNLTTACGPEAGEVCAVHGARPITPNPILTRTPRWKAVRRIIADHSFHATGSRHLSGCRSGGTV